MFVWVLTELSSLSLPSQYSRNFLERTAEKPGEMAVKKRGAPDQIRAWPSRRQNRRVKAGPTARFQLCSTLTRSISRQQRRTKDLRHEKLLSPLSAGVEEKNGAPVRVGQPGLHRRRSDSLRTEWILSSNPGAGKRFLSTPIKPAPGPTQLPVQWLPRLFPEGTAAEGVESTKLPHLLAKLTLWRLTTTIVVVPHS